ncbi:glycosyltransferase family 2 protein [Vibrio intestinalis]|uniref:glycosyltransferase family 2 protein n=1 Tax=Vibrio intestinalis TaxID=2933291 RepID=UPI0021A5C386|nr:glycosyltransferase family 2 protein [Vibrio intestinalis]
MNEIVLQVLFVTSVVLILYHHFGYPLLLRWLASRRAEQNHAEVRGYQNVKADRQRRTVTIIVPAYNEQRWIADKIRNLAALDYPRSQYKVIIACDGCTDDTVEIAQQTIQEAICSDTHFEILAYEKNRGKVALINHLMPTVSSDITVLSDVSCLVAVDALIIADKHFQSYLVGVVNSQYCLMAAGSDGEAKYWRYQAQNQLGESELGANIGAHGALFAFRTHLFENLPQDIINDDFVLPMQIIRKGYIAVYEPMMIAIEQEPTQLSQDIQRRLRISAGNMQQAIHLADLFLPKYRGVAFAFASGKGLRLATPYLMIISLVSSLLLISNSIFFALLLAQIALYLLAILGHFLPKIFKHKLCRLLTYLMVGHCVNFIGGLRYLIGLETGHWKKINNN